nr:putative reverse transcriptase domain, ribonuclease H-like domain protein [Tanacetum cinerariifolium]
MLKDCDKDPTEISKIIRKANETLPRFKERWASGSNDIPNVPELMQISSFMSSHKCPELAKHFSDSIPRTVDEMLKRVDDYLRSKKAFRSTELPRGEFQRRDASVQWVQRNDLNQCFSFGNNRRRPEHKPVARMPERHALDEILATKHQLNLSQPVQLVGVPNKENLNRKTTMMDKKWMSVPITFPPVLTRDLSEEAFVVDAKVEGYLVWRIHIDEGASIKIMFEHYFNMLHPFIRSRLVEMQTTLFGFSGERLSPSANGRRGTAFYTDQERNYAPLEKITLALRHASRRLRRYFEARPITVITDQSIKKILNKADTLGRLAQYSVELAAYNITYEPRSAIKGQILAYFINEVSVGREVMTPRQTQYTIDHQKDCKEEWVLYTDGASSAKGFGAGLVLINHTKTEYAYGVRLNFKSTNNQAEYEALLAGLRIAKKMEANYVIRENHMGSCSMHLKAKSMVAKATRQEIGMPTHRTMMIKEGDGNEEDMRLNHDLLTERREATAIREARYKMKMEQYYNKRVCPMSFKVGEYPYRKNEAR